MAITTEDNRTAELTTDGVETGFDFSFLIHDDSEVQVWYEVTDGEYVQLALGTNYTINFTEDGGTVTTIGPDSPYAAGKILIIRHILLTQLTNWLYNDKHSEQQHQDDFDRSSMRDIQMQDTLDRVVTLSIYSDTTGIILPEPEANYLIGWNAGGTNLANISIEAVAVLVAEDLELGGVPTELTDLTDVTIAGEVAGHILRYDGAQWTNYADSNYQTSDATLTSIALLGTAADKMIYTTGVDTWAETALTAFARSILDDVDEATFKATVNLEIGVDVLAQQTIGIIDDNLLEVDGGPNLGEYARFTLYGLEGRTVAELGADGILLADGTVDLTDDWVIATNSITLTAGTVTAEQFTSIDDISAGDRITAGGTITGNYIASVTGVAAGSDVIANDNVTAGDGIFAGAGTAITDIHSFQGDTNTGMWSSAADILNFSTGNVERFELDSAEATFTVPIRTTDIVLTEFSGGNETIGEILDDTIPEGILDAFTVTDAGGVTITWSAGEIWDSANFMVVDVTAEATPQGCTDNAINYLKWVSGTTLTLSTALPSGTDVLIASINCADGDIWEINQIPIISDIIGELAIAFQEIFPSLVSNGLVVSEHAADEAFDVDMSAGTYFNRIYGREAIAAQDSSIGNDLLTRWYKSAAGVWTSVAAQSEIDETQWNNGNVLAAVGSPYWYRSLFFVTDNGINWLYPTAQYVTKAQAIAAPDPALPAGLNDHPKSTVLILQWNATALPIAAGDQWIDVRPIIGSTVSGDFSDHGNLTGLTDDDHTQYVLNDAEATNITNGTFDLTTTGDLYAADATLTDLVTAARYEDSSLVAHFQFGQDGDDSSSYGNNGTLNGGATATNGVYVGDGVNATEMTFSGTDMSGTYGSLMMWVKTDTIAAGLDYAFSANATGDNRIYFRRNAASFEYFWGDATAYDSGDDFVAGEWVFIGLTWNNGTIIAYWNGEQTDTQTLAAITAPTTCFVGALLNSTATWDGEIDNARVYSRTLAAWEMREICNNEQKIYGHFNDLTVEDDLTVGDDANIGGDLSITGDITGVDDVAVTDLITADRIELAGVAQSSFGGTVVFSGSGAANFADTIMILPLKTTTGDPAGPDAAQIYVNTFDNKVRVYAGGAWRDLVTW